MSSGPSRGRRSSRSPTEGPAPAPEMEVVASQLKFLKNLKERIQNEERRVTAAHQAVPELQDLLVQRRAEIETFSGVLADLMRLQAQARTPHKDNWENPFLVSALSARVEYGRLPRLAADAKEYHRSLLDSLDMIEKQIDTAQSVISASGGVLARMQGTRSAMLESIKLQYGLIHPIHRLSDDILAYVFSLVVSEKFETVRMFRGDPEDCPEFNAPVILASVCSTWRDIAYTCPSLWDRVVVTDFSLPSSYWRHCATPPITLVAVGGALFGSNHAQLPSLASCTPIGDLTITSRQLSHIQFDPSRIKSIRRLTAVYPRFQHDPTGFFVPGDLNNLSSLTCIHNYPLLYYSIPSIRIFSLFVRVGDHQPQSSFSRILRYSPNLETLSLSGSPILSISIPKRTEHKSLSTIKSHFSAFKSLSSALNRGTLILPSLSHLEISELDHENLLKSWNEVFPFDSWPSQVTYLHIELRTKSPRMMAELYRLLIPFASITTLSIANEALLPALLPTGVVPVARDLVRLRVEGCAFDGRALLDVVLRRNWSEWVARREVKRLALVELWDCPNVPPATMRELRRLRGD